MPRTTKIAITKVKYIFILIFIFSVSSITLQATIVSFLKDHSALKKQMYSSNLPDSAEEEDETEKETEKTEVEEDDLFSEFNPLFFGNLTFSEMIWPEKISQFSSRIISIHTPPPEL